MPGQLHFEEGLLSPRDGPGMHVPLGQQLGQQRSIGGVVVHHKDADSLQPGRDVQADQNWGRLPSEPDREGKDAALARITSDANLSAHQPDQTRGDGQPQAGPAVFARDGAIRLLERLEDRRLFAGGDANSGV